MLHSLVARTGDSEHMPVTIGLGFTFRFLNVDRYILLHSFTCHSIFFVNSRFHITDRAGGFGTWFNFGCFCVYLHLFHLFLNFFDLTAMCDTVSLCVFLQKPHQSLDKSLIHEDIKAVVVIDELKQRVDNSIVQVRPAPVV